MDKNNAIGLVLILLILLGWSYWMSWQNADVIEAEKRIQDSLRRVELENQATITEDSITPITVETISDSMREASQNAKYGSLATIMRGEEKEFELENNEVKIQFSNKGGIPRNVELKHYKKQIQGEGKEIVEEPVRLLEDPKNKLEYWIPYKQSPDGLINTGDLYFQASQFGNTITFTAQLSDQTSLQHVYTIPEEGYVIDHELILKGFGSDVQGERVVLNWENYLDKIEINTSFEKFYSTIYYKESSEDVNYCSCRGDDTEDLANKPLRWISAANQFFNTSFLTESNFKGGVLSTQMMDDESEDMKKVTAKVNIPFAGKPGEEKFAMQMFIGPNDFEMLREMNVHLEEIIPFGRSFFGSINRWIIRPLFNFLSSFLGSMGIAIILLTLIVKILLFPLTYKMLHSQAKMGALKPKMASLKEKFKDDQQKQQMETMKLYREFGVNPLGGCLPMVFQMPIWFALYRFFPASIEFRQAGFLWAHDLSSYDVLFYLPFELPLFGAHISLFTILWAGTTVLYTYYNSKFMDMNSVNPMMKYVQYLMPLMFLFYFNNYASGLTCYLLFSNLINIGQTVGSKAFLFDDSKILSKLEENAKKPKKKGGFAQRLETAMKEQQRIAQQKQTSTNKKKRR